MVPENWHICVNKGITYLLKSWVQILAGEITKRSRQLPTSANFFSLKTTYSCEQANAPTIAFIVPGNPGLSHQNILLMIDRRGLFFDREAQ